MRKPKPLTQPQIEALALAKRQGGTLYRTSVGWGPEKFDPKKTRFSDLFSHGTVRSLVTRHAMAWTAMNGTQWTQATIVEAKP
jgi:hypothetical protein